MECDPQKIRVHIRWMIRRDLPKVLAIEEDSFEFPWGEEDFIRHLRQRDCIGMVAEHDERIVGFMVYALHKRQLRLRNLAVASDVRRRGIGTQMVGELSRILQGCMHGLRDQLPYIAERPDLRIFSRSS